MMPRDRLTLSEKRAQRYVFLEVQQHAEQIAQQICDDAAER